MKKTSRSKKVRNTSPNFKVFYQNVKGLKSRVNSIIKIISNYQPILICLVEYLNNVLEVIYNNISKQISVVKEEKKKVLILRDFNEKADPWIEGNQPTVTKEERQTMKQQKIWFSNNT